MSRWVIYKHAAVGVFFIQLDSDTSAQWINIFKLTNLLILISTYIPVVVVALVLSSLKTDGRRIVYKPYLNTHQSTIGREEGTRNKNLSHYNSRRLTKTGPGSYIYIYVYKIGTIPRYRVFVPENREKRKYFVYYRTALGFFCMEETRTDTVNTKVHFETHYSNL